MFDGQFFPRQPIQFVGVGYSRPAPVLTFIGDTAIAGNSASRTFTAHAIGTASTDRLVIVCFMGGDSNSGGGSQLTGVTIGGVAANIHVNPGGARQPTAIASLLVTTGTTADIVTTRTGATGPHNIAVYTLTGYLSATPVDTDGINSSATGQTSRSTTLDISANGVAIYALSMGGGGVNVTWSTASEDCDVVPATNHYSSAHKTSNIALSAHVETASFTSTYAGISGVSWA